MKWYSDLYVGDTIKEKKNRIVRQVKQKGRARDVFLVALPANPGNLLDIIPSRFSGQYEDLHVIGIAKGKDEACQVAAEIIGQVYRETGAFDIPGFLRMQEKKKKQEV